MDETSQQEITIARLKKVRRMIAILDSRLGDDWVTALTAVRRFTDDEWLGLGVMDARVRNPQVDVGRVQAPSPVTRRMIIDALEERLRIRQAVRSKPAMQPL